MAKFPGWAQAVAGALFNAVQNDGVPDLEAPRRVVQQLGEWGAHLSQNAAAQWGGSLLAGQPCVFEGCEQDAMGPCVVCGDPVCLAHSHVNYLAELVCDHCVDNAIAANPQGGARRPHADPVAEALRVFCVTREASFDDINAIYRRRMQTAGHPDKGGTKESAQLLNRAFEVLKEHYQAGRAA